MRPTSAMRCSNWGGAFRCRFKRTLYRLPYREPLSPQGVESPRGIVTYGRGYESATGSLGGGSVAGLAFRGSHGLSVCRTLRDGSALGDLIESGRRHAVKLAYPVRLSCVEQDFVLYALNYIK